MPPAPQGDGASRQAVADDWHSIAFFVAGCSKFHRTLRCARDPCPADGLVPPGSSRPRRQPLVRAAPGTIRIRSCRTSRLSTPRARGPVLAAGARKRHIHVMRLPPHAAVRPLPNRRHWSKRCLAPSPEGQWRRHAARPARRRGQSPAGSASLTPDPPVTPHAPKRPRARNFVRALDGAAVRRRHGSCPCLLRQQRARKAKAARTMIRRAFSSTETTWVAAMATARMVLLFAFGRPEARGAACAANPRATMEVCPDTHCPSTS